MASLNTNVFFLDGSKRCEISGFLLSRVAAFLKLNGYTISNEPSNCDTVIVNTCCVTQGKTGESEFEIKKALNLNNPKRIIMLGCLASIENKYSEETSIIKVGSKDLDKLNTIFQSRIPINEVPENSIESTLFASYQKEINLEDYYVLISQGCSYNCSYCNIKKSKGEILSRTEIDIVNEIKAGLKRGKTNFVLLADDCGSYGHDINSNIVVLINKILDIDPNVTLKISTIFPQTLIKLYAEFKQIFTTQRISYINVPIQSGSERILKLMNRNYDINELVKIIKEIKSISPNTWFYTHIMINFPTETRDEFLESFKVASNFDEQMVITFSSNPLTQASKIIPKIDAKEIEIRIRMSENLMNEKRKGIVVGNNRVTEFK